jgi:hypothetical protein
MTRDRCSHCKIRPPLPRVGYCRECQTAVMRQHNPIKKMLKAGLLHDLLQLQEGLCAICFEPLDPPIPDHDHHTGELRGLLCRRCNMGLGMFLDDEGVLLSAIAYLRGDTVTKAAMHKYNAKKREEIRDTTRAPVPSAHKFDWIAYYGELYDKLGLEKYKPQVLTEIASSLQLCPPDFHS